MPLDLVELARPETRAFMLAEFEADVATGQLYLSPRLLPDGITRYPDLLRAALVAGNEETFALDLARPGTLARSETSRRTGRVLFKAVPPDVNVTLAEAEFNRFYARAVCRVALAVGEDQVLVYRARTLALPRPDAERLEGRQLFAAALLRDLRAHIWVDSALGLATPGSGLSVRLAGGS